MWTAPAYGMFLGAYPSHTHEGATRGEGTRACARQKRGHAPSAPTRGQPPRPQKKKRSSSRLRIQGDRTNLIIPLSWFRTGSTAASVAELEPGTRAHASVLQRLAPAPPHRRGRPARPRSVHLGSPPLVRSLSGGRREGAVQQDQ